MKYYFEIQTPHSPGCGWLRSPHGRDTWDKAMAEGVQYVKVHHDYANLQMSVRVHCSEA